MRFVFMILAGFGFLIYWMLNGEPEYVDTVIAELPIDDRSQMSSLDRFQADMDYAVSSDGNGSLRLDIDTHELITLYKVWGNNEDVSFRRLVYEAKVKTENVAGPVFLVMQAGVTGGPGDGLPVIGREQAITGTNDWTTLEVFAGNASGAKHIFSTLQLEVTGPGTVWIDDVRLISRQAI